MIYNYHTHTARCRHAFDTDEDYVLRAIEGGIRYMGFSDHAPFIFPDGFESHYRILMSEIQDYFNEINRLREKYKDKIELIGVQYVGQMVKALNLRPTQN